MTSPQPTDPSSANPWFDPEHHFDSSQPTEVDIAETNPLDPTEPDALHRLLQALHNL